MEKKLTTTRKPTWPPPPCYNYSSSQVNNKKGPPWMPPLYVQGMGLTHRTRVHACTHGSISGTVVRRAMEKYENLGLVGEGSYGMVLKCKHKETGQIVAIKKFLESEDDKMVKKIAMREVRMLKQLRHENLVNLIEVFRRKKRLYLVFEFVDHTVLDDLERCPNGLDEDRVRKILWQVLKGIEFCHIHNIIHRDVKPENILVSRSGVVKLCDFGFARTLAQPGEAYTDYVATRWYRAPELLVGDTKYGRAVDIWAVGCLLAEMLTGEPLFPGDSDIDQLYHIVRCFGNLTQRHREIFHKNPLFVGMRLPEVRDTEPLERKFPRLSNLSIDFMKQCLQLEANDRPTCSQLLRTDFFAKDGWSQKFTSELKARIQKENIDNPLLKSSGSRRSSEKGSREGTDDNKEKENKKKKKEKDMKEKKESKDNNEDKQDKPKRKLPDPEKFIKKTSPIAVNSNQALPPTTGPSNVPSRLSHTEDGSHALLHVDNAMPPIQPSTGQPTVSQSPVSSSQYGHGALAGHSGAGTCGGHSSTSLGLNPSSVAPQGSPHPQQPSPIVFATASINNLSLNMGSPVFNHNPTHGGPPPLRVSEKVKKTPPNFYKKPPGPGHHSPGAGTGAPGGKKSKEEVRPTDRWDGGLSLPEVRGAEANPNRGEKNKNKKGFLATMPHITTLDPFQESRDLHITDSTDSNLPKV